MKLENNDLDHLEDGRKSSQHQCSVLWRRPIGDAPPRFVLGFPLERRPIRFSNEWIKRWLETKEPPYVAEPNILGFLGVFVVLVTREEPPAAVFGAIGLLAIRKAEDFAIIKGHFGHESLLIGALHMAGIILSDHYFSDMTGLEDDFVHLGKMTNVLRVVREDADVVALAERLTDFNPHSLCAGLILSGILEQEVELDLIARLLGSPLVKLGDEKAVWGLTCCQLNIPQGPTLHAGNSSGGFGT